MSITVEAIYEDGVLKPAQPLPLKEHEKVQITVEPTVQAAPVDADEAERFVRRSYGLLRWTGSVEDLRYLAESPDLDPQESA